MFKRLKLYNDRRKVLNGFADKYLLPRQLTVAPPISQVPPLIPTAPTPVAPSPEPQVIQPTQPPVQPVTPPAPEVFVAPLPPQPPVTRIPVQTPNDEMVSTLNTMSANLPSSLQDAKASLIRKVSS
jgi:hypothetical protein